MTPHAFIYPSNLLKTCPASAKMQSASLCHFVNNKLHLLMKVVCVMVFKVCKCLMLLLLALC